MLVKVVPFYKTQIIKCMVSNKVNLSITLNLELDCDLGISASSMMERLDNVISDALTNAGDGRIMITRVESE